MNTHQKPLEGLTLSTSSYADDYMQIKAHQSAGAKRPSTDSAETGKHCILSEPKLLPGNTGYNNFWRREYAFCSSAKITNVHDSPGPVRSATGWQPSRLLAILTEAIGQGKGELRIGRPSEAAPVDHRRARSAGVDGRPRVASGGSQPTGKDRRRGAVPQDLPRPTVEPVLHRPHLRWGTWRKSVPFGKYGRTRPLGCSFRPRSQEWWGGGGGGVTK